EGPAGNVLARGLTQRITEILWGIFEINLEKTVWVLSSENPEGKHPGTDAKPITEWIKKFRDEAVNHHERITTSVQLVIKYA
ncbi:MAG: hypothetical protein ACAH18_13745, partial [Methylophilaceae bacterium]